MSQEFLPVKEDLSPEKKSIFQAQEDAWAKILAAEDEYECNSWWDYFAAALKDNGWSYQP